MEKIVIASNNKGKIKEIKEILSDFDLLSLNDANVNIEVEEDELTFEKNSQKKAREISEHVKLNCISDDSGLCIDVFDGWPGVFTARFLGENSTKDERNDHILEKMKNLEDEERKAKVVCCISYYDYEAKNVISCEGIIEGKIATEKRGKNGFGFDEIFELPNGKTLAELSVDEKNEVSARKLALIKLKEELSKKKTKLNIALEYAEKQHEGQKRDEGTPYFTHIEGVVSILRDEFYIEDEDTLIVGALHDTIEDTSTTFEDIEKTFGKRIAKATDLLTKKEGLTKEEYFKNIFENQDFKFVAIVKLADRLHNMRCIIKTNNIEKIKRKVLETEKNIYIYENDENKKYIEKIREAIIEIKNKFEI